MPLEIVMLIVKAGVPVPDSCGHSKNQGQPFISPPRSVQETYEDRSERP